MANEIKLEFYNFGIRTRRSQEYINLDKLTQEDSFLDFFSEYITFFDKQLFVNDKQKKSIQFEGSRVKVNSRKRMISGIIESGDYGVESKIVNKDTQKQRFKKTVNDLDIKPFYFLIHVPENSTRGFLVLQRLGIYGINSVLASHFASFIKDKFADYLIDFSPVVSKSLAKNFIEKGNIRELTLRRYNLPSDVVDKLGLIEYQEDILSIELKITAKAKHKIGINRRVKKFVGDPNTAFFDVPELKKMGFDGESESKVKISLGKNTRTIDLSDTGQIRPYYDIHDEVKIVGGHPEFESIDQIAKSYLNDLLDDM